MTPFFPVSKVKRLDNIRVRKQNRNPNRSNRRKVVALDFEAEDGNAFLLRDSEGKKLDYPNITFENLVKFLFRYEGKWCFFWHLGYDALCFLKFLPRQVLDSYKKNRKLKFHHMGYVIHYIPNKQLTIRKGKHSVSFYDIAQYYGRKKLEKAFLENFDEKLPDDYLKMKDKRKDFTLEYYLRHKKETRKYCKLDCDYARRLSEKWLDTFNGAFVFYPRNWVSSGYCAEKVLLNNKIPIPRFNEIPYIVQEIAWFSFYGGRFELIKRGFIGYCCLYDINSAYPFALTQLPDLTDGEWYTGNEIHPNAKVGFFHIIADIDNCVKVCPFPFRNKNKMILYPHGKFETYVTLHELLAVRNDKRTKYKILESSQFVPNKNCSYPFRKFIAKTYQKRLELGKNNPQGQAIKLILNSMYGKMAQTTDNKFGNLFNPVIATFITGYARAQLYKFVGDNNLENHVIAFATDSIAIQKKIPNLNSTKLGEMKLDKEASDAYYLSNGYYRFNGVWKKRGIGVDPDDKSVEIEHVDTLEGKDGQIYIEVETTHLQNIKSAIIRNLHKDIGKIRRYKKKVYLNSDRKRLWNRNLERIDDNVMCDSAPINLDIEGEIIAEPSEINWSDDYEKYEPESDL